MLTRCCIINSGMIRGHTKRYRGHIQRDTGVTYKEIQKSYQPVLNRALEIRGRLALVGLREIRAADISSLELEWKADMCPLLGLGEFATVIEGKMKRHGEEQSVALKIWNESIDINNASHVLAEASLLRYEFFLLSILLRDCILS